MLIPSYTCIWKSQNTLDVSSQNNAEIKNNLGKWML